ncbi:MAG: site-specific DNA-methyltransferase [Endomicrobium sp.]|jgi:site-specific DNA-methyltransferase (adenine-specific)/site-specific DNA-methyltransferase (cytosine-N4-specific)|nr:site-specific DNA-methyltransferase [Endomicrobium sp.]
MKIESVLYLGDSKDELKHISDNSIDLIITSPPYADQRKTTYGGIHPNKYVEWFLPISEQLLRVLKPSGTFILNIKEKAVNGERSTYVIELILAMRKQGWFWTEEFIWHKKNSYPGKWPNRFRDSWEHLLQFNKSKKFNMYQEAVMVPMGDWAKTRLKNLSDTDKIRDNSKVGSGFGKNVSNWLQREKAYPTNVLHIATECNNKNHSAAFPQELPEWFIKLFTKQYDVVLDPFMGSGTSLFAAKRLFRNSIGIDIVPQYYNMVKERLIPSSHYLFEQQRSYEKIKYGRRSKICRKRDKNVSSQKNKKFGRTSIVSSFKKEKSISVQGKKCSHGRANC